MATIWVNLGEKPVVMCAHPEAGVLVLGRGDDKHPGTVDKPLLTLQEGLNRTVDADGRLQD